MNKYLMICLSLIFTFCIYGCEKETDKVTNLIEGIPVDELLLKAGGEVRDIVLEKAEGAKYEITSDVDWATVHTEDKENQLVCILTVQRNESSDVREGILLIKSGEAIKEVALRQKGAENTEEESFIDIKNISNTVSAFGGMVYIRIESNMEWTVEVDENSQWLTVEDNNKAGQGCGVVPVTVSAYSAGDGVTDRTGRIRVISKDGSLNKVVQIIQKAFAKAEWKIEGLEAEGYKATDTNEKTFTVTSNVEWDNIKYDNVLFQQCSCESTPDNVMKEAVIKFKLNSNMPGTGKRIGKIAFMKGSNELYSIDVIQNNPVGNSVQLNSTFRKQNNLIGENATFAGYLTDNKNWSVYTTKSVSNAEGTYLYIDLGWNVKKQYVSFQYKTPTVANGDAVPYKIKIQAQKDNNGNWTDVDLYNTNGWKQFTDDKYVADKSMMKQWQTSTIICGIADEPCRYWKMLVLKGAKNNTDVPTNIEEKNYFAISELWVKWYE